MSRPSSHITENARAQSHATMRHRKPLKTSDCPEFHHGLVVRALSHCVNAGRELVAHSSLSASFVSEFEMPNKTKLGIILCSSWSGCGCSKKKKPCLSYITQPLPPYEEKTKRSKDATCPDHSVVSSFLKRLFFFLFLRTLYGRIPRRPTYQHGQDSSARAGSCALYQSSSCYSTR